MWACHKTRFSLFKNVVFVAPILECCHAVRRHRGCDLGRPRPAAVCLHLRPQLGCPVSYGM